MISRSMFGHAFARLFLYAVCPLAVCSLAANGASAADPETVAVGDAGNKADGTGFGAVPYAYRIGKFEVTNEEYTEFLNGVAATDTHGLYDPRMASEQDDENYGGIVRFGTSGSFKYSVKAGKGKWPVNYVNWESCARYANWLSNGRGKGDTETGPYAFKFGSASSPDHKTLAAGKKVTWVIASEDEWYKAAYYDPKKAGGAGYWKYPGKSDDAPRANINTNEPCDVNSFDPSAYGTYCQGGNLWEYNDRQSGDKFGLRGGSFFINDNDGYMSSGIRYDVLSARWPNYGFRIVALGQAESK